MEEALTTPHVELIPPGANTQIKLNGNACALPYIFPVDVSGISSTLLLDPDGALASKIGRLEYPMFELEFRG